MSPAHAEAARAALRALAPLVPPPHFASLTARAADDDTALFVLASAVIALCGMHFRDQRRMLLVAQVMGAFPDVGRGYAEALAAEIRDRARAQKAVAR